MHVYIQCKGNIFMKEKYSLEDTFVCFPWLFTSLFCVVVNVSMYVCGNCTVQWWCVCTYMFIIGISASGCPHLDLSHLALLSSLFVHINCTYVCILYVSPSTSGVQVLPKSSL